MKKNSHAVQKIRDCELLFGFEPFVAIAIEVIQLPLDL
jgi:hypothetical protein